MAPAGDDFLVGTSGPDFIDALDGNDFVDGADGKDNLRGGNGDDWLGGGASTGTDTLSSNDGANVLAGLGVEILLTNVLGAAPSPGQVDYLAGLGYTTAQFAMRAADAAELGSTSGTRA